MKAQEALDSHPTAKKAFVNAEGEWHFSTPPTDFKVVDTLVKSEGKEIKLRDLKENEILESIESTELNSESIEYKNLGKRHKK